MQPSPANEPKFRVLSAYLGDAFGTDSVSGPYPRDGISWFFKAYGPNEDILLLDLSQTFVDDVTVPGLSSALHALDVASLMRREGQVMLWLDGATVRYARSRR